MGLKSAENSIKTTDAWIIPLNHIHPHKEIPITKPPDENLKQSSPQKELTEQIESGKF